MRRPPALQELVQELVQEQEQEQEPVREQEQEPEQEPALGQQREEVAGPVRGGRVLPQALPPVLPRFLGLPGRQRVLLDR